MSWRYTGSRYSCKKCEIQRLHQDAQRQNYRGRGSCLAKQSPPAVSTSKPLKGCTAGLACENLFQRLLVQHKAGEEIHFSLHTVANAQNRKYSSHCKYFPLRDAQQMYLPSVISPSKRAF